MCVILRICCVPLAFRRCSLLTSPCDLHKAAQAHPRLLFLKRLQRIFSVASVAFPNSTKAHPILEQFLEASEAVQEHGLFVWLPEAIWEHSSFLGSLCSLQKLCKSTPCSHTILGSSRGCMTSCVYARAHPIFTWFQQSLQINFCWLQKPCESRVCSFVASGNCPVSRAFKNHTRTGHDFENSCCWMLMNTGMSLKKLWCVTFDTRPKLTITVICCNALLYFFQKFKMHNIDSLFKNLNCFLSICPILLQ